MENSSNLPLQNLIFYVDLPGDEKHKKISQAIIHLGGKVEQFLNLAVITDIITSRPIANTLENQANLSNIFVPTQLDLANSKFSLSSQPCLNQTQVIANPTLPNNIYLNGNPYQQSMFLYNNNTPSPNPLVTSSITLEGDKNAALNNQSKSSSNPTSKMVASPSNSKKKRHEKLMAYTANPVTHVKESAGK